MDFALRLILCLESAHRALLGSLNRTRPNSAELRLHLSHHRGLDLGRWLVGLDLRRGWHG